MDVHYTELSNIFDTPLVVLDECQYYSHIKLI